MLHSGTHFSVVRTSTKGSRFYCLYMSVWLMLNIWEIRIPYFSQAILVIFHISFYMSSTCNMCMQVCNCMQVCEYLTNPLPYPYCSCHPSVCWKFILTSWFLWIHWVGLGRTVTWRHMSTISYFIEWGRQAILLPASLNIS